MKHLLRSRTFLLFILPVVMMALAGKAVYDIFVVSNLYVGTTELAALLLAILYCYYRARIGALEVALEVAVMQGDETACSEICKRLGRQYSLDPSLVCYAVANGNPSIVKLLISHGADVNGYSMRYTRGAFPLLIAAHKNDYSMCQILLESGARVDQRITCGEIFPVGITALDVAREKNSSEIVTLLSNH